MNTPVIEVGGLLLALLHLPASSWALRCVATLFPGISSSKIARCSRLVAHGSPGSEGD